MQQPHPPVWMASLSPDTFELCGTYGFNLMCAPVFGFNVNTGAQQIEQYRQALRDHGRRPEAFEIAALTMTYVAETTQQALADFRDAVMWYYRTFAKYIAPPKGQPAVQTYEFYQRAREFLEVVEWDAVVNAGAVVCGSPDEVAERIAQIQELTGLTHYLAWTRIGGLAHPKVIRSMELMAERVMPQLRRTAPETQSLAGLVPEGALAREKR
jgi:alkanesulfonate monooxygenase SsuD/methylene tetrahydromethanopterin reductase-like flavin-dependent oxidoreductase (luciferase family)